MLHRQIVLNFESLWKKVSVNVRWKRFRSASGRSPPGRLIEIDSQKIHYEIIGHGKHHLLLNPGGMGSARTDWLDQMNTLDKDVFTLIAWDPPGYGYSEPPDNSEHLDAYQREAKVAGKLLQALEVEKVSIMGWCGGGLTSIVAAAQNLHILDKLILVATAHKLTEELMQLWEGYRDVMSWTAPVRDPLVEIYGLEEVQAMWDRWLITFRKMQKLNDGHIITKEAEQINRPTLIIHAPNDKWVLFECGKELSKMIKTSKFYEFKDGNHYPHMLHTEKFNKLIQDFITEKS